MALKGTLCRVHDNALSLYSKGGQTSLVDSGVLLRALDSAADAIAVVGAAPNGRQERRRFEYVNRAFEDLYQCSRTAVVGTELEAFFEGRSSPEQFTRAMAELAKGEPFSHTRQLPRPDGTQPWIHVNFQPFDRGRWIYIIRDITQIRLANVRIAQLLSAVERASEPIAIFNFDGSAWHYDFVNEAFLALTGFDLPDLVGAPSSHLISANMDIARIERNRTLLLEGQTVRGEAQLHRKDRSTVVLEFTSQPLRDQTTGLVTSTVTVFHDVTESRLDRERLEDQATHDALTGLYNRRWMERSLKDGIDRAGKNAADQAFLFIDLDGFKAINDRYGHDRGDEALRQVARALKSCIWGSDVLARWGGDEFAALIRHCSLENAVQVGERMTAAVKALPGLGASIGVTMLFGSVAETVRRADEACYAAKKAGGNRTIAAQGSRVTDRSGG